MDNKSLEIKDGIQWQMDTGLTPPVFFLSQAQMEGDEN